MWKVSNDRIYRSEKLEGPAPFRASGEGKDRAEDWGIWEGEGSDLGFWILAEGSRYSATIRLLVLNPQAA